MKITKLDQLFEELESRTEKKRLIAVWAIDDHTIGAVSKAVEKGIVEGVLVGDEAKIIEVCKEHNYDLTKMTIINEPTAEKAAKKSVEMINAGEGDLIMKGLLSTDVYMRAILNKEYGIMAPKAVLSHVTVMENPNYQKLMIVGDVAVLPAPDLNQKIAITNYLVKTSIALGTEKPKVAVITASEQMLPKMQACVDAAILSKMGERGQIKNCIIEGPISLDLAIDKETAAIKGMDNEVAGDADCLLFPNIEAGNVFYKTNTKLAGSQLAALVAGAKVPAILSSRGDSIEVKLYSIALGALTA